MTYLLFRSKKFPERAITIAQDDNGLYSIPVDPTYRLFDNITEIENALDDELELIRSKKELN